MKQLIMVFIGVALMTLTASAGRDGGGVYWANKKKAPGVGKVTFHLAKWGTRRSCTGMYINLPVHESTVRHMAFKKHSAAKQMKQDRRDRLRRVRQSGRR